MENLISLLFDRRFPIYFHYNLLKKILKGRRIKKHKVNGLAVSLTFDIEKDPINNKNIEPTGKFLRRIRKLLKFKNIEATFFIQANLIEDFSIQFKNLQKTHELGLHGYAHELWGYEQWWDRKKSLSLEQKRKLMSMSLEAFEKNNLERPISFRAPNLIINKKTLALIKNSGFKIDSSLPSYLGIEPLPKFFDNLLQIPHTANPIPKFQMRSYIIPFIYYDRFTFPSVLSMSKNEFLEFVENVTSYQISSRFKPHLVFLAHSWEFIEHDIKMIKCSEDNYKSLLNICNLLERNYQVEYITLNKLATKLGLID
jgi:peptidoglycan/xylan/chitin deacetylase (PgdA/CDA1 family)